MQMRRRRRSRREGERGFTLIELGIVVAVIAILATVVLVGRGFMESARVSKLTETVSKIADAVSTYAGTQGGLIPNAGALQGDLIARNLAPAGVGAADGIVPNFTISVTGVAGNPQQFIITIACPNAESCADIFNARAGDPNRVAGGAGPPATLTYQL